MDRASRDERSSRRARDDREHERDRLRSREGESAKDRDRDRERDHKHRHHHRHQGEDRRRDDGDDRHHHHRRRRSPGEDSPEPPRERSPSRARGSVERDESVDRRRSDSRKRRDHREESPEDTSRKRARVSEERKERRRFEEEAGDRNGVYKEKKREEGKMKEEALSDEEDKRPRRKERRFTDSMKVEEKRVGEEAMEERRTELKGERKFKDKVKEEDLGSEDLKSDSVGVKLENGEMKSMELGKSGAAANAVAVAPLYVASKVSITSAVPHDSLPTKVSSITTTNENEGVNVTRSDEVPGKFSTDGASASGAGKSGNLSLDALAKAKKALQMQKELAEKLKKIPTLNKLASTSSGINSQALPGKDGNKISSPVLETQPGSSVSTTSSSTTAPHISSLQDLSVGVTTSQKPSSDGGMGVLPSLTAPNYEAVKRAQELAAKMGFRQDPDFAPLINMFSVPQPVDAVPQRPTKAPVLRLDAQGREIDEHGNVISMPKPTSLSTLKVNINKQKKEAFQILRPDLDVNAESNPHFDAGMGINKTKLLRPKRMSFQFVEEGKWSKQAEIIKFKNQFGEARAKELKMKQSQLAKLKGEPDINPNLIQVSERVRREKEDEKIPDIEWWDLPLLPSGAYIDVAKEEKLNMEKITVYVEHPRPIEPPAEPAPPPPQPLKLTKKEQKKLRTQRRLAKERDRQEMIRQGLIEPPKPKVKMSNLMKVLGSEATQDPTRLEMEIRSAAAEREQAHVDRNIARKLTPAERREKKERKLFEDPNALETLVSVYKISSLSHRQTRFKVDVNAQENRLTGCAVIADAFCVVAVEGGKKSIGRYGKLMLKRINWAAAVGDEEEGDEKPDAPPNRCDLVWQGSVAKPSFNRFTVHQCRSEAAARKLFADAGVPHYWDLAVNFSEDLV